MVQKFASLILAVTLFSPSVCFAINFFLNPENRGNHVQTSERHLGVLLPNWDLIQNVQRPALF